MVIMNKKWISGVVVATALTLAVGGAVAAQGFARPANRLRAVLQAKALGVTAEQQEQIKALVQQQRTENQALIEQVRAARQALAAAISAVPPDAGAVEAASANLGALQAQAIATRARAMGQIFQLLRPDQQQKLQTRLAAARRANRR